MSLNIVLVEPEIPNNTGNIGRLSLATGSKLHLIKPLGFDIDDKRVKRAGLDYWQHVDLYVYENTEAFFEKHKDKKMALFSSHSKKDFYDLKFEEDIFLLFGKESTGFTPDFHNRFSESIYKIPLHSNHIRSLNLSNAVAVVVYEGLRQLSV